MKFASGLSAFQNNMEKKSETLSQREKAQKDLLELKKMKAGMLDTEHLNDDDKKIVPKTLEEKTENFFYHHKAKVIVCGFLAIVLTVMIASCFTKINYDAKITVYCYEFVDTKTADATGDWFEELYPDVNGNGKTEITCVECSFADNGTELQETITTKQQKIITILNDPTALLFILDDKSIEYLNSVTKDRELFTKENIVELPKEYYEALSSDRISFKDTEKKRYLCLRSIEDMLIEEDAKESFAAAKEVLNKVKKMTNE